MISLVRAIGWLAILVIAVALAMAVIARWRFSPGPLPVDHTGGFTAPVIAMEFVETTCQAEVILDQDNRRNRKAIKILIWIDFVWIACYTLLFFCLSYLLARRNCPWATYLRLAGRDLRRWGSFVRRLGKPRHVGGSE